MTRYDVVVVGGGINGVGVAQAVAAAGHSVLLLEKTALAAGTSSKSSKLIHGGLRYLETYEFSLVREGLRERALMLRTAPDLVHLRPFYIPVYKNTRRRPWLIRAGLSLYALLGNLRKEVRFETLPKRRWEELDGLTTDGLEAVFRYTDAQTDDALLTAAVMKSAMSLGAELAQPAEFVRGRLTGEGCSVDYRLDGREVSCESRVLVNAAGPWVNLVLGRIEPRPRQLEIDLIQGSHIIVDGVVEHGLYYMEVPRDGRAVFVMPWKGRTLVGTTETRFRGEPDQVKPLKAEENYLLRVLHRHFARYRDQRTAKEAFAGLRVLPSDGGHAFHRSREVILLSDRTNDREPARLLSVYGGKLTSWRATAERVMGRIRSALPSRKPVADTGRLTLTPP